MKKLILASLLSLVTLASAQADLISQWDFNRDADGNLPNATSPAASFGSGTASLFGGVNATGDGYASGQSEGRSSDPANIAAGSPLGNNGWQINSGWNPGGSSLSQGVQFSVSTVRFLDDVVVSWDLRQSDTSSRFSAFQYTQNGSDWATITDPTLITIGTNPSTGGVGSVTTGGLLTRTFGNRWLNQNTVDLSGLVGAGNPNFAFRILAAHDPNGNTFVQTDDGSSPISATGTWRFDMVTVSGTAVPEPTSMALLAVAGLGGLIARRFRKKASPAVSA